MDWIVEHLQVLFFVAIAIVAILQKLKVVRPGENPPGEPQAGPEDTERTRRIQEEIRRRIMERRGLVPLAPPPQEVAEATQDSPPPIIEEVRPVVVARAPMVSAEVEATTSASQEFERQQQLIGQFRELEASRRASTVTVPGSMAAEVAAPVYRMLPDLRSPRGLRRAIVLREVLGPPVGLR
jgi:hypothetical protein